MLFHVHLQHKQLLKLSFINLGADDTKTACIFRLAFTDLVFFRNHIEVYQNDRHPFISVDRHAPFRSRTTLTFKAQTKTPENGTPIVR